MKKKNVLMGILFILIILILIIFIYYFIPSNNNQKISDPAAEYCTNSGYDYKIETNVDGSQYGTCIFLDNSKCSAWDFFCKCVNDKRYCSTQSFKCKQECME